MVHPAKIRNDELAHLLRGWLAEMADAVASRHGRDSEQFRALAELHANIDDAVRNRLWLSDLPQDRLMTPERSRAGRQ